MVERLSTYTPVIFFNTIFKGIAQIMLQENTITGILFLLGVSYGYPLMGLALLTATIAGTITAILFRFDKDETIKGIYGFSAALVGAGLILLFKPSFLLWIVILMAAGLASVIQNFFSRKNIPVYTLPFILVVWLVWYLFKDLNYLQLQSTIDTNETIQQNFTFIFSSIGQVIFQDNVIIGILFFIGLAVSSTMAALVAVFSSAVAALFAYYFQLPTTEIVLGLYGYNAVLCAIVFADIKPISLLWIVLATLLSIVITIVLNNINIIPLTFPFVASCWILLLIKNQFYRLQKVA